MSNTIIDFPASIGARLQADADAQGRDVASVVLDIVADWYSTDEVSKISDPDAVAGIQRGLAAAAAGDEMPFEDYVASAKAQRALRNQGPCPTQGRIMPDQADAAEEEERFYPIRITGPAANDIDQARDRFAELSSEGVADAWQDGLFEAIRTLSRQPHRLAVVAESRHFQLEVRQLLYRRPSSRVAYRVLFTIVHSAQEPPLVRVLHVRHAARRPITRAQAREIEAAE